MPSRIRGLWLLLPIIILGIGASLVVDLEFFKTFVTSTPVRILIKGIALALSSGAGVVSYVRSEQRHRESSREQQRREAVALLESTLASSIQNLFIGERPETIRANLMVAAGNELRMLAGCNMLVFPDSKVRLRKGQGCAGAAWQQAFDATISEFWRPVVAMTTDLTRRRKKDTWHLSDDQIRLTSHILWIVSIPLFRTRQGQRTFLGVLNFDGVHERLRNEVRLSNAEFLGECASVAERVAEIICSPPASLLTNIDASSRKG